MESAFNSIADHLTKQILDNLGDSHEGTIPFHLEDPSVVEDYLAIPIEDLFNAIRKRINEKLSDKNKIVIMRFVREKVAGDFQVIISIRKFPDEAA